METFKIIEQSTNEIWDIQTKTKNRLGFAFLFYRHGFTRTLCISHNEIKNKAKGLNLALKKMGSQSTDRAKMKVIKKTGLMHLP